MIESDLRLGRAARGAAFARVEAFNMPHRVQVFQQAGTSLMIGRREAYRFWDVDGREFYDFHLNGGTYNLGHRHPELVDIMRRALDLYDIGNHHLASDLRGRLAERLVVSAGPEMELCLFAPGGGEANDIAIKSVRRATGKRRIISLAGGFHGRTGLSGAVGDPTNAQAFLSDHPDELRVVPFDDIDAIEQELLCGDVAGVLVEVIPATLGFPMPGPQYLRDVRELCDRHDVLLIADEVQTGLLRSGSLWSVASYGVQPDVLVTGKGLGGGLYPVAAVVLNGRAGDWIRTDGWGYVSTSGGAELGACVALGVLDILERPETISAMQQVAAAFQSELHALATRYPLLEEVRQRGVIIGLKTNHPNGGRLLNRAAYQRGLWAYAASFDTSVLQFKPGLLFPLADIPDVVGRLASAVEAVEEEIAS